MSRSGTATKFTIHVSATHSDRALAAWVEYNRLRAVRMLKTIGALMSALRWLLIVLCAIGLIAVAFTREPSALVIAFFVILLGLALLGPRVRPAYDRAAHRLAKRRAEKRHRRLARYVPCDVTYEWNGTALVMRAPWKSATASMAHSTRATADDVVAIGRGKWPLLLWLEDVPPEVNHVLGTPDA